MNEFKDGPYWFAVHTAPQNEAKADENLRRQGFMTFYPFRRVRVRRKMPNRDVYKVEWIERPYFPRYLFVALRHEHETISAVNDTDAVSTVVHIRSRKGAERQYLQIPARVMDALMKIGDGTGFMSEEDQARLSAGFFGKVGQQFRFSGSSAFAGLIGTISCVADLDRSGQIKAFIDLFGGTREVDVPVRMVAAFQSA